MRYEKNKRNLRQIISILTAIILTTTTILPSAAVMAEDQTNEPETVNIIPDDSTPDTDTDTPADNSESEEYSAEANDAAEPTDSIDENTDDKSLPEDDIPSETKEDAAPANEELPAEKLAKAPLRQAGDFPAQINIEWEGDEPEDKSSRPYVVYLIMERSIDGENWETYSQLIPFTVTSFDGVPWETTFLLPAEDDDGNPYTYRVTETTEGLGRYLVPSEPKEITEDSPDATFTNTYNDEWDYHLRMFWDVSDEAGRILQDIQTTSRNTQELTYHIAVSTQKPYEACDDPMNPTTGIVARIPRKLCTDRDGNKIYPTAISVGTGEDYDPYYYFKYDIDPETDELVFYNWMDLPGSYNIDIKVQYKLDPRMIEDCTLSELQAQCEGHYPFQPATDDGKQSSDPIFYRLDTGAEFTKFTKDDGYPLRAVPPVMSESDFDFSTYHYMVYILRYEVDGNQPLTPLQFFEQPTDPNGEHTDEGGKVIAILQPAETDSVSGTGENEIHTYRRLAPALSTPSGTPVEFTPGEDGSATWAADYDLLRKSDNGNYANQGEQCYYIIVRYNATDEQGYIINDKIYNNDVVTGGLEVADEQHPLDVREVNDFKDTDAVINTATGHWEPEVLPPVGPGPYYAHKQVGENAYPGYIAGYTRLKYKQFHIFSVTTDFNVDGEWLKENRSDHYFYADWYDDDVFMRGYYDDGTGEKWHEYVKLGPKDYQIWYTLKGSIYFDVTAYDIDADTGQHIPQEGVFTVQVKNQNEQWVDYDTFTLDSTGHARYEPDPLGTDGLAGKGYYGIRLKTPEGMTSHLTMKMNVWYIINGTSPVARDLLDNKGATDLHIINHATNDLYLSTSPNGSYHLGNPEKPEQMPPGEYDYVEKTGIANYDGEMTDVPAGYVRAYRSDGNQPRKYSQNVYIAKGILNEEDHQDTHSFSHQWSIAPCEYMNTSAIPRTDLQQMEYSADTGVIYDLLPPGYHLDETRPIEVSGSSGASALGLNSTIPASLIDYTITPNFRGTGRDLVTFRMKSDRAANDNLFISTYTYTGFTLHFWTKVSYFDVEEQAVNNLCAYQRGDKRAMVGDVAYSDMRGYGVDISKYLVNGEIVLTDLDGDGIEQPKSTMYFSTPVHPTIIETLQDGLFKYVRGNSGQWGTEDQVDLEGTYHYQILLETADGGTTSDVVLYDVLEDAANTGGASGEAPGWKGVLQDVDTNRASAAGIYPVVYYTTENVSYNDGQSSGSREDWENSLVKRPEIWSTEMPDDPSEITAIAVDLRWADEARTVPFKFTGAEIIGIDLTMKAPARLQPSPYAYNRPAFTSKIQVAGSPNASQEFTISTRTRIELRDLQNFEIFKYYETINASGNVVKQSLGGVTFELYQCTNTAPGHVHTGMPSESGSCWGTTPIQTKVTLADGIAKFTGLDTGEYAVIESGIPSVPVGLEKLDNRWWTFHTDAQRGTISTPVAHTTDETAYPVVYLEWDESRGSYTLKNDVPLFNIAVKKKWEGPVPSGTALTFDLYIGDDTRVYKTATVNVPSAAEWTYNELFTGLSRFDTNSEPIRYRLVERSNAGYIITSPADGSVVFDAPETGDYSTEFTNARKGWLEIEKKLDSGDRDKEFTFEIALSKDGSPVADGTVYQYYKYAADDTAHLNPERGSVAVEEGKVSVSLKADEMIRFYDLDIGVTYEVTEEPAAGYRVVSSEGVSGITASDTVPRATITNAYEPAPVTVHFEGIKTLNGRELKDAEFRFTLYDSEDAVIETVTNNGTGKIVFSDITYNEAGTYNYTVQEEATTEAGVTIDSTVREIIVEVTDDGEGHLVADVTGGSVKDLTFVNEYKPASVAVHFEGAKTLNGRELKDAEFSFTLYNADGDVLETAKNDGSGKIVFSDITYDAAGTYNYTVKEDATTKAGITIDTTVHEISVEVTDDGEGQLVADVVGGAAEDLTFINDYTLAPALVYFEGIKILHGRELRNAEFSFTLSDADGNVLQTVKNDGTGKIIFNDIFYEEAGIYTYTIREDATTEAGVTIDSAVRNITVEIIDDGEGRLAADVIGGSVEDLTFINDYKPSPVTVHFEGAKTLNGRELKDAEFSFTLFDADGNVLETVRNDGAGKIIFSDITYDETGIYNYSVKEDAVSETGVTIDSSVHDISVKVTDDGTGKLNAEVTGGTVEDLTFVNEYKPSSATVHFQGAKTLNGRELQDAEFSFTLYDAEGNVLETVKNDKQGKISFSDITYDTAGTYTYQIKEDATTKEGVTIDSAVREITVKVTDDGDGNLVADVSGGTVEDLTFVNEYKPAPATAHFEGVKTLNGRSLKNAEFSFSLYDESGDLLQTVKNDGQGRIIFDDITYNETGTYNYTVKEDATDKSGITIDSTTHNISVEVIDDGNGKLSATVKGGSAKELTFVNEYKPSPITLHFSGSKTLNGKELRNAEFSFTLYNGEGEAIETVRNDGQGKINFSDISYDKPGIYTYEVKEDASNEEGVIIDSRVYRITVAINADDNGELKATVSGADINALNFTNKYSPNTGDSSNASRYAWILLIAICAAGYCAVRRFGEEG